MSFYDWSNLGWANLLGLTGGERKNPLRKKERYQERVTPPETLSLKEEFRWFDLKKVGSLILKTGRNWGGKGALHRKMYEVSNQGANPSIEDQRGLRQDDRSEGDLRKKTSGPDQVMSWDSGGWEKLRESGRLKGFNSTRKGAKLENARSKRRKTPRERKEKENRLEKWALSPCVTNYDVILKHKQGEEILGQD